MKHKTWFRLVLKAIGILLIAMSIGEGVNFVIGVAQTISDPSFTRSSWWWLAYSIGAWIQLAIGLYLLLGGEWIVNLVIPSNRPYCPDCGYEVSKVTSSRCPECGAQLPKD